MNKNPCTWQANECTLGNPDAIALLVMRSQIAIIRIYSTKSLSFRRISYLQINIIITDNGNTIDILPSVMQNISDFFIAS